MRSSLVALSIAVLSPAGLAQVAPTDILVNLLGTSSSIDHYRADGTLVQRMNVGTGVSWAGASLTPTGEIVCTRRVPFGVNVFDPVSGNQVGTFDLKGGTGSPGDVSVFSDGTLAVSAFFNGEVQLYTQSGTFLQAFAPASMGFPYGSHVDSHDHLWVCDLGTDRLFQFDRTGLLLNELDLPFEPFDLVVAPDDTLWITGRQDRLVHHYDRSGNSLGSFPTGISSRLHGLALAVDGSLWVAGDTEVELQHFDPSGASLGSFPVVSPGARAFVTIVGGCGADPTSYCTAGTTSSGCHATMAASGTASLTNASPFTLSCTNVEGNRNGIFFYGTTGRVASSWGANGSTWLCVKAPTQRMNPLMSSGGAAGTCSGSFSADWNAYVSANPAKPINAAMVIGTRVGSQAWFRDPASGTGPPGAKGTALSDAIEFTVCP